MWTSLSSALSLYRHIILMRTSVRPWLLLMLQINPCFIAYDVLPNYCYHFFWAFLWYRSPCPDHQLYFLVGKLKGLPEFGVCSVLHRWFLCLVRIVARWGCSGSSCGFSWLLALQQCHASSLCCLCCCCTPPSARMLGKAQFLLRTNSSVLKMLHWELRVVQAVACEHGFCFWTTSAPPYRLHGWSARQLFSTSLQR